MATTEPTIDSVAVMREIRERMSRDMEGMTKDEILRFLNEGWRPDPRADEVNREHVAAGG
jgi:hypothetical protein